MSYLSTVDLLAGRLDRAIQHAHAALKMRQELSLHLYVADDWATLALAHLSSADIVKAADCAQRSLTILRECGGEGPEFPHRDYFICHQVFAALGQDELARVALESAYRLVMSRAEKIKDPALRQSFLEHVPINREIVQAARQHAVTYQATTIVAPPAADR